MFTVYNYYQGAKIRNNLETNKKITDFLTFTTQKGLPALLVSP